MQRCGGEIRQRAKAYHHLRTRELEGCPRPLPWTRNPSLPNFPAQSRTSIADRDWRTCRWSAIQGALQSKNVVGNFRGRALPSLPPIITRCLRLLLMRSRRRLSREARARNANRYARGGSRWSGSPPMRRNYNGLGRCDTRHAAPCGVAQRAPLPLCRDPLAAPLSVSRPSRGFALKRPLPLNPLNEDF